MKSCLIISPTSFYGLHSSIAKEISSRGYYVTIMNDEYPNSQLGLLIGNFANALSRLITYRHYYALLNNSSIKYDLIVIFKGRGVSLRLIELLRNHAQRVISYNWDSLRYFNGPINWYKSVDKYSTFDFTDSNEINVQRIDLFSERCSTEISNKNIDISCIMKNHSDRLVYLDRIYKALNKTNTFYIYIYEKNFLTLLRNLFRHPLLIYRWRKFIYFKGLSIDDFLQKLGSSKFTLDYAHPKQSGITMRCFQAMAFGTRIITNNKSVALPGSFTCNHAFVFDVNNDPAELIEYVAININNPAEIKCRSIKHFANELLD
jgi:hypothetical protein